MVYRLLRFLCVLIVMLAVVPVTQAGSEAVGELITQALQSIHKYTTASQDPAGAPARERTQVLRLRVLMLETRAVSLEVQLTAIVVASPEIAAVVLNSQGLTITGLKVGETILIGFAGTRRLTFLVEVVGRTYANSHQDLPPAEIAALTLGALSGSYAITYTAPFAGAPTLLRQSFDLHKKLTGGRTFRFSSDMFKFMGHGDQYRSSATAFGLGVNRMSLGIDGPDGSIDILDSNLNISPLSFNGSIMRGVHIVSTRGSRLRGMEFFAGQARPSLSFFDMGQGRIMGAVIPIAEGEYGRVRAGMFVVSPGQGNRLASGGTVWHLDGRFAPNKNVTAEGEVDYAKGGLSWRARLDLIRGPVTAYGEILRVDRNSPLVSVGAQEGGRETEASAVHWRASSRLNASFSFNHTAIAPPANAGRAYLNRTSLFANASYKINDKSRLDLRFAQQKIEIGAPGGSSRFQLETRTATIGHDIRLNQSWTNNFQAQVNSSRETRADAATEGGFILNEQLRYSFKRGSATGFVNYTRQQSSLAGLLVRNPTLLPPTLQAAFAADPVGFLQTNRDALGLLLPGVDLPQTRGVEAGARLQAAFSRINMAGEVRYRGGEILSREQRNIITSTSVNWQMDAANSLQVSGSRSFGSHGTGGQSALTVSYVHRFGAGSGGGLQFSRMLGLERGSIQGRVFIDLNGNGHDDLNEPGVAGMKIQLGGDRSATTDSAGHFHFRVDSGGYQVSLISEDLGVRWRASTMTEQHGVLSAGNTVNVSFGITDYGSVAGRVFNDISQKGEHAAGSLPGVAGVRLTLRPANATGPSPSVTADGSGSYQFRNIPPGNYTLELDPETLPADFAMLRQTSWPVVVRPLQNFYLDIPISAQRAVSGFVFVDQDGNGKFDPEKDQPIAGARVRTGKIEVVTGSGGAYILRNIPYGTIEVRARSPWATESTVIQVELGAGPTRRYGINLCVPK